MPLPLILAAVTLSVSDVSGAQLRGLPSGGTAVDLRTTGTAALSISAARSSFFASYSPSLGWVDVTRDPHSTLIHGAQLGYGWGEKRLHLSVSLGGSLGTQSYLSFAGLGLSGAMSNGGAAPGMNPGQVGGTPQTPAPNSPNGSMAPGLVPRTEILRVGSVTGAFGLDYELSQRWRLSLGVGYALAGGIGESERVLPKSFGPNARASLAYKLTRRDTLGTSGSVTYTVVPTFGSRFIATTLMETWGHTLTPRTQTTLGIGLTHLRSRASADADYEDSFQAAGTAAISNSRALADGSTLGLNAGVSLSTPYNPVLGVVQQQLTETLGVGWQKHRTSLTATLGASQSLPQSAPTATRVITAGTGLGYRISQYISAQLGAGWSTQILPPSTGGRIPAQWLVFAGISLAAPALEL
jgi:hypothetical protein